MFSFAHTSHINSQSIPLQHTDSQISTLSSLVSNLQYALLLDFLYGLYAILVPPNIDDDPQEIHVNYLIIWDNVSFHKAAQLREWFTDHPRFSVLQYTFHLIPLSLL